MKCLKFVFVDINVKNCPNHVIVRLGRSKAEKVDRGEPGRQRSLLHGLPEKLPTCTPPWINCHPVYEQQTNEARRASPCPYTEIHEQNERIKEDVPWCRERDRCLEEVQNWQFGSCGGGTVDQCTPACLAEATTDLWERKWVFFILNVQCLTSQWNNTGPSVKS